MLHCLSQTDFNQSKQSVFQMSSSGVQQKLQQQVIRDKGIQNVSLNVFSIARNMK